MSPADGALSRRTPRHFKSYRNTFYGLLLLLMAVGMAPSKSMADAPANGSTGLWSSNPEAVADEALSQDSSSEAVPKTKTPAPTLTLPEPLPRAVRPPVPDAAAAVNDTLSQILGADLRTHPPEAKASLPPEPLPEPELPPEPPYAPPMAAEPENPPTAEVRNEPSPAVPSAPPPLPPTWNYDAGKLADSNLNQLPAAAPLQKPAPTPAASLAAAVSPDAPPVNSQASVTPAPEKDLAAKPEAPETPLPVQAPATQVAAANAHAEANVVVPAVAPVSEPQYSSDLALSISDIKQKIWNDWAEKFDLIEKENEALRTRVGQGVSDLRDIQVDVVQKLQEDTLRQKIGQLEKEIQEIQAKHDREKERAAAEAAQAKKEADDAAAAAAEIKVDEKVDENDVKDYPGKESAPDRASGDAMPGPASDVQSAITAPSTPPVTAPLDTGSSISRPSPAAPAITKPPAK